MNFFFRSCSRSLVVSLEGVHFFFSSITGIALNATKKISKQKKKGKERTSSEVDVENVADDTAAEEEEQFDIMFDPGVAYFISYTPNEFCNKDIIYKLLHENDMDCKVNKISTLRPKDFDDENSMLQFKLSQELDAVVKDHDSPAINSLIRASQNVWPKKFRGQMSMKICLEHIYLHQKQNLLMKSRAVCTLSILKLLDKTCKLLQKS